MVFVVALFVAYFLQRSHKWHQPITSGSVKDHQATIGTSGKNIGLETGLSTESTNASVTTSIVKYYSFT